MTYEIRERVELDRELVAAYEKLTTGTIGHRVDGHAVDRSIRPLAPCPTVVGHAITVRAPGRDSTVCHKVIDLVEPGDIIVIDRGGDDLYACWGEMMTIAARIKGARAVIVDGPATDLAALKVAGLPVFCRSVSPLTTQLLGQGGSINTTVECGGLMVSPGDLIIADDDGVLIFTPDEAKAVLAEVEEEAEEDEVYRTRLLEGIAPSALAPIDELIAGAASRANGSVGQATGGAR